ncbi:HK97-gp10 family putative phage morphogenesis protein [Phyllobacterium zundukense]|uniref:HK97 gp10 family phage protein n=1 Tax=Phyllobacterium zundukense TaxID=1867719 RepID=A0ACD4D7N5_9HYPH|nr:HK97-gp10 family putative phage morphogenesis protein [Phyllobacterium zundukense]UXN61720.1 HK97 gp10 family phage protein [Phyllobacterium zundukense]
MAKSEQYSRIQRKVMSLPKAYLEATVPALEKSAEELADLQRRFAPEDTGALKNSIAVTGPKQATPAYSQPGGSRVAAENEVLVTAGNSDVRYAHLVEYGTAEAEAQAYFWPAYRILKKRIANRVNRASRKAIKERLARD